jgi:hypothetical protein
VRVGWHAYLRGLLEIVWLVLICHCDANGSAEHRGGYRQPIDLWGGRQNGRPSGTKPFKKEVTPGGGGGKRAKK